MTQTKKKRVRKSKARRRETRTLVIFWVCLLLLLIPVAIMGWLLLSAALDTGSPILGDRYKGDLDPAITKADLEQIESSTKGISGVQNSFVNLATATLRVYADIDDNASVDTAKSTATRIYNAITEVLPQGTYFTQTDTKKMYDLEIHVYTAEDREKANNFVYVIETKTSSMDTPSQQVVSEPLDAQLAQHLRDEMNGVETTQIDQVEQSGEMTLSGETIPEDAEIPADGENTEAGEENN